MSMFLVFVGIIFVLVGVFFLCLCVGMCVSGKIKNPGSVFVGNSDMLPKDKLSLPRYESNRKTKNKNPGFCKKFRNFSKELWERARLD